MAPINSVSISSKNRFKSELPSLLLFDLLQLFCLIQITEAYYRDHPPQKYILWHDRATFHFLTDLKDVEKYLTIAHDALNVGGFLIVSTFSTTGPDKCSGLTISKYSQEDLKKVFGKFFQNTKCFETTHTTLWGTTQDFVYCGLKKLS